MAKFVNKESLAQSLSNYLNISKKEAHGAIDLIFNEMSDAMENEGYIDITGFGKFEIFDRKARMGINPVTKERIEIQATKLPKFRPSQTLKNRCNKK